MKIKGWWAAGAVIGSVYIATAVWGCFDPVALTPSRAEVLGDFVAVAMAVSVAYLGFDRFRHHKRAQKLSENVSAAVPIATMLIHVERASYGNDEMNFLAFQILAGNELVRNRCLAAKVDYRKNGFYRSWPGRFTRMLLVERYDRKVAIVNLLILASWLTISTAFRIHPWSIYGYMFTSRAVWIGYQACLFGTFLPPLAWVASEKLFAVLGEILEEWKGGLARTMSKSVQDLALPDLADLQIVAAPMPRVVASRARPRKPPLA